MPKFKYVATDATGVQVSGVVGAATLARARNELLARQLRVIEVKVRLGITKIEITKKKVKRADLMNFSRQLAAFLRAGIPIVDALDTLTAHVSSKLLGSVLVEITDALRSGSTLSEAMSAHAEMFPSYYVGILRSAELSGQLDVVLDQLALYIERDAEGRRAVKSALTYPIVILFMAVITVTVLVGYVLPKFEKFFSGFGAELPITTRLLLSGSAFFTTWLVQIALGFVLVGLATFVFLRTRRGKLARDRFLLRIPVLGSIVRCAVIERFCRILGSMLRAGVPVDDCMTAAIDGTNNRVYEQGLIVARDKMLRGGGLAVPLSRTNLFPGPAEQMLLVGEASGTLDDQLGLAADFYGAELANKVKRLTALFEPVVIIIMGLVVGFVAVALVQAMYGIFNQVHVQ